MIRKEKRKNKDVWILYTADGSRILGIHANKGKAMKQEYAIRISKARKSGHNIPNKK